MNNEKLKIIAGIADSYKRTNKSEAFDAVKSLINAIDIDDSDNLYPLVKLYSHFLPSVPKKPKSASQWVALAKASKKDTRKAINYVWQQENGDLVATDGKRIHIFSGNNFDTAQALDSASVPLQEVGVFPDYSKVIPDAFLATRETWLKYIDTCPNVNTTNAKTHRIDLIEDGKTLATVDAKHWHDATGIMNQDADVHFFIDRVVIEQPNKKAMIMTVRV